MCFLRLHLRPCIDIGALSHLNRCDQIAFGGNEQRAESFADDTSLNAGQVRESKLGSKC